MKKEYCPVVDVVLKKIDGSYVPGGGTVLASVGIPRITDLIGRDLGALLKNRIEDRMSMGDVGFEKRQSYRGSQERDDNENRRKSAVDR